MKERNKIFWIGFAVAGLLVLSGCNDRPANTVADASNDAGDSAPDLHTLLRPTNSAVVSGIPVTALQSSSQSPVIEALGRIDYDTRRVRTISARVTGRIERLYVKYRYQHVHRGDPIMDIYSPELVTAQQDLLFLLHNDPGNSALLDAAREKLRLLGMDEGQVKAFVKSGKPIYKVTVYTPYTGHIHEAGGMIGGGGPQPAAGAAGGESSPGGAPPGGPAEMGDLPVKEGMYIQKGQTVFQLFNTDQSWIILSLYAGSAPLVKIGSPVTIVPEAMPDRPFQARISVIEPFYRDNGKNLIARVYFNNAGKMLPVGSQVRATIQAAGVRGNWLPRESVLSLGLRQVVLKKEDGHFQVSAVQTGIVTEHLIQITGGLDAQDSVAADAQFLMDSESFIKVKG